MTVAVLSRSRTDYSKTCTVESDQVENWPGHSEPYNMDIDRTQKSQAELSMKWFSLNFSQPIHLRMVKHQIVIYIISHWIVQKDLINWYVSAAV